jgi:acetyl-CoA C-acetyltransferase
LNELQQRHQLDTSKVDDIVLGCVTPIVIKVVILPKLLRLLQVGMMMLQVCKSTVLCFRFRSGQHGSQKVRSGWEDLWLLVALSQCHVFQWVQMVDHGH